MGKKATDAELGRYARVEGHLRRLVETGVRPAEQTAARLQAIAQGIPDPLAKAGLEVFSSDRGLAPPWVQCVQLKLWNHILGLGFTEERIDRCLRDGERYTEWQQSQEMTLCWTTGSLNDTVSSHIEVLKMIFGDKLIVSEELTNPVVEFRAPQKAMLFKPGQLWWEFLKMNGPVGESASAVDPTEAAGTEVLSLMCQHKPFAQRMQGMSGLPYINIPGLLFGDGQVPCLMTERDGSLNLSWCGTRNPDPGIANARLFLLSSS